MTDRKSPLPSEPEKAKLMPSSENRLTTSKFQWPWIPYERLAIISVTTLFWGYIFIDFFLFNQRIKENVSGLVDSYFGLKKDHYDTQWRAFANNLHVYFSIMATHLSGTQLIKYSLSKNKKDQVKFQAIFNIFFGLIYVCYIFRAGIIFWFLLSFLNYQITKFLKNSKFFSLIIWLLTLLILYCNETYHGYQFSWIHEKLNFLDQFNDDSPMSWHLLYNITILKVLSFCFDWSWACKKTLTLKIEDHLKKCRVCDVDGKKSCLKARQEAHLTENNYNALYFWGYLFYPPLFLAGPVVSYNAFISQMFNPQNSYTKNGVAFYVCRVIFDFICFEIFLHCFYVCALSNNPQNTQIWQTFTLSELGFMSFLQLIFIWFKFLNLWRLPRAWALVDGIESPENMNRCMCNNYNFEGFWRSWHRSFNQWLIRYIFIPLGGSKFKLLNIWVVFSFVAIWHDMKINLILWAWGICIALMPEMLIRWNFSREKYDKLWKQHWWKYLCGLAGGLDILLMVTANLIGFGIGWNGLLKVFANFTNLQGFVTIGLGIFGFWLGALCMFMVRDFESDGEKGF